MIDNDRSGDGALLDFVIDRQAGMAAILQNYTQNTTQKQYAAVLVADDSLPDQVIADRVGISRKTLHTWKRKPEFIVMVKANQEELAAGLLPVAIANKRIRLEILQDLIDGMQAVVRHRRERYAAEVSDAESAVNATRRFFGDATPAESMTGYMVKQETLNNAGKKTVNWALDTGLIRELRAVLDDAAKEVGQRVEKREETQRIEISMMVKRIAEEAGLDEAEIMAEAHRILAATT